MSLRKITAEEVAANGVQSAPDILTGTPKQNKEVFDRLVAEVVVGVYNGLIDALTAPTGAGEIGTKLGKTLAAALLSDDVDALRLNADGVIEVRKVGSEAWEATGSSGHLILDKNGVALPQRSRMQFANCEVSDDGTVTVVRGVKGDKGDTGAQGIQGIQGVKGDQGKTGLAIIPEVDQNTGLMRFTAGELGAVPSPVYVRGPQGPQGVQGQQGGVGPQGPYGPQGLPGDPGPRGVEGPQGPRGAQGEQGAQGPIGLQGPQGLRGDKGDKGDKGDTGDSGPQGVPGTPGIQGNQGLRGEQGIQGPAGVQGAQGIQGAKGDRGLDGRSFEIEDVYPTLAQLQAAHPTGASGAYQVSANMELYIWSEANLAWQSIGALEGPQGPQGPQGVQGPAGPQGEIGAQGVQGVQGPKGDIGPQGAKGDKGDKGDTGPKGDKGDTGEQGIQGIQGPVGAQGPKGDQGIQGAKGDTGATGPKGDPATVNGKTGANITLTAADVGALPTTGGTMTGPIRFNVSGEIGTFDAFDLISLYKNTLCLGSSDSDCILEIFDNIKMNGYKILDLSTPTDPTDAANKGYVDGKQLVFTGKTVPAHMWSVSTTYRDLGYSLRTYLVCAGVTTSHRPDVTFTCADALSGNFAPVAESSTGGVYIYCKTNPTTTVTIPSIVCVKGE